MIGLLLSAVLMNETYDLFSFKEPAPKVVKYLPLQTAAEKPRVKRVLMFTAEWCYACKTGLADFGPWLEKSGWQIDDTDAAHCQLIDADERPDMVRKYRITSLPTFVLIDGDKELRRTGYAGRMTIPTLWGGK